MVEIICAQVRTVCISVVAILCLVCLMLSFCETEYNQV